jgi:hypothetical protein
MPAWALDSADHDATTSTTGRPKSTGSWFEGDAIVVEIPGGAAGVDLSDFEQSDDEAPEDRAQKPTLQQTPGIVTASGKPSFNLSDGNEADESGRSSGESGEDEFV